MCFASIIFDPSPDTYRLEHLVTLHIHIAIFGKAASSRMLPAGLASDTQSCDYESTRSSYISSARLHADVGVVVICLARP